MHILARATATEGPWTAETKCAWLRGGGEGLPRRGNRRRPRPHLRRREGPVARRRGRTAVSGTPAGGGLARSPGVMTSPGGPGRGSGCRAAPSDALEGARATFRAGGRGEGGEVGGEEAPGRKSRCSPLSAPSPLRSPSGSVVRSPFLWGDRHAPLAGVHDPADLPSRMQTHTHKHFWAPSHNALVTHVRNFDTPGEKNAA